MQVENYLHHSNTTSIGVSQSAMGTDHNSTREAHDLWEGLRSSMHLTNFKKAGKQSESTIWLHFVLSAQSGKELVKSCANRKPTHDFPIPLKSWYKVLLPFLCLSGVQYSTPLSRSQARKRGRMASGRASGHKRSAPKYPGIESCDECVRQDLQS